jgi:hypothetical protein
MGREKEKEGKETGGEGEGSREEDGNKRVGRGEVGGARSEERKGRGGGEGKIWTPTFWIKVTSLFCFLFCRRTSAWRYEYCIECWSTIHGKR